jgi:hypothetical protein
VKNFSSPQADTDYSRSPGAVIFIESGIADAGYNIMSQLLWTASSCRALWSEQAKMPSLGPSTWRVFLHHLRQQEIPF